MDMKLKVAEYIAAAAKCCFENCGLGCEDICAMIETPPDKKMGDYALPCFRLSKVMRCAPQMIAGKLAEKVACEEIDHVEVVGGYILGYILCALIVGALSRKFAFNFKTLCLSMVLGVAVCYAFGTIWFMAVTGLNLATSMSYCVIPFLPGDVVKILLAAFLALRLRKLLAAQGFAA